MAPLKPATFKIDVELLDGLERIRARDGINASEQVRRAIRAWLDSKGGGVPTQKPARKRAATRKRA